MTAIELNAQLLRELSYISGNEGYLQKTLDFIKKLTKSDSATNTRGIVYTEMLERLSDYQEYEKGWDGDNALPSRLFFRRVRIVSYKVGRYSLQPMAHCFFRTENESLVSTLEPMAIRIMRLLTEK